MGKRKNRKFREFDPSKIPTPVSEDNSNFNTSSISISATKSSKSKGSKRENVEGNTSTSEDIIHSDGHENITVSGYQVNENVLDQSNACVASKIQNLSVSSSSDISSEILDVKVDSSYVSEGLTECYEDLEKKDINNEFFTEENASSISTKITVPDIKESVATNDAQIGIDGHTNLKSYDSRNKRNQTSYAQKTNSDNKRFKERQSGNDFHSETKSKWVDNKKHLKDQSTFSNNSFDRKGRGWHSSSENNKNRSYSHSQSSQHFETGQRNRSFHDQNKPICDNTTDFNKQQTVSNSSQGTENIPEENWDSPPQNKNMNNENRFDKHNSSRSFNNSFRNQNKSRYTDYTPDLKQQQTESQENLQKESWDSLSEKDNFDNNFSQKTNRDSKYFKNDNKSKPSGKKSRWGDVTTDLKEQQTVSNFSLDTQNYQEETWDSPSINENLDNKNGSNMYTNSATNVGEWNKDYESRPHIGTSTNNSGALNVDAQEYVPPCHMDSNQPKNNKEYTDDDYFTNNLELNKVKNKTSGKDNPDPWRRGDTRHSFPFAKDQQSFSERYSGGSSKDGRSNEISRDWRNSNSYNRRSESSDKEFRAFCDEERKREKPKFIRVKEIEQDLFAMPKEFSLAHCVAEDMRMGSGIAVSFKREFKDLDVLLQQRQKQGGLAVLEAKGDDCTRYIYYLVTKRESNGKPTYEKFWSSVKKMRDHIKKNNVGKLAIPRLGCGLDKLEWDRVKHMIEFLFKDVEVEIIVCNFQQIEDSPEKPLIDRSCKVVHELKSIADIAEETTIIYLSSEEGYVSSEMEQLSKKFSFLQEFKRASRQLGCVVRYEVPKKYFILYGCIVRKRNSDPFDFVSFNNCLKQINKNNRKDKYEYVGIQAVKDDEDDLLIEKLITLLRNNMSNVHIYVCWDGELAGRMPVPRYSQSGIN